MPHQPGLGGQTINRELAAIHKFAPSTSAKAYAQAEAMIMNGYMTFSEDEIDGYAPD